jgi:hypothetical protein
MKDRINSFRRFSRRVPLRDASFSETDCQPLEIIGTAGGDTTKTAAPPPLLAAPALLKPNRPMTSA